MPVALHVEDDLRASACQASSDEKRDKLVHPLHESRVRPESSQLAPDPPRQKNVEEHAVELAGTRGRHQMKALVLRRPAFGSGREHTMVDNARDLEQPQAEDPRSSERRSVTWSGYVGTAGSPASDSSADAAKKAPAPAVKK